MYSENNRRSASRRADDDFLRRMLGGELTGDGFPVMNADVSDSHSNTNTTQPHNTVPQLQNNNRIRCDGSVRQDMENSGACPTTLHAPSLAMVYSPKQCWRNLFDPATGLSHGTIFAELALPLEVVSHSDHKEVKNRRPL